MQRIFHSSAVSSRSPRIEYFVRITIALCVLLLSTRDAAGQSHLWSQRFGGTGVDHGLSVSVDGSGNVFVSGGFRDTVDFGGGGLTSAGEYDMFLAKYDASGSHLWSQRFGSTSGEIGRSVIVDGSGNVFVTGWFRDTVDFGGGGLTSAGWQDIFLAKYDASGSHLWSQRFGDTSSESGRSVSVDGSGNVFVTGWFSGTVDFGGGPLTGSYVIFLAKFDPSGAHLWSQRFSAAGGGEGWGVAVDGSGNVFVTGWFLGPVDFGGGEITSGPWKDIFLAKFDPSGAHLWSKGFSGGTYEDEGRGVCVDDSGNVFVTGEFNGTVDFGGGGLTSAGYFDIFLAKFDPSGALLWSERFGDTDNDGGSGVSVDGSGNVYVTGFFGETVDFGGGPLASAGGSDIFVAKFGGATVPVAIRSFDARAALLQNAPNPFNPTTTIHFTLEKTQRVSISIYDARGRHVRTLFDDVRSAGPHTISWDGKDDDGVSVGSGVYFYQLSAGKLKQSNRMVLLK